jgi:hypothetical protein
VRYAEDLEIIMQIRELIEEQLKPMELRLKCESDQFVVRELKADQTQNDVAIPTGLACFQADS